MTRPRGPGRRTPARLQDTAELRQQGNTIAHIAMRLRVTERTVWRYLARLRHTDARARAALGAHTEEER